MIAVLLLLPIFAFSHVTMDEVSTTDRVRFSLATVCKKMVPHESPLVEVVSGTVIDCMGKKVDVGGFCDKELAADPYYIRAYVDKEKKEVVCQSGKKVLFKYLCVKLADRQICGDDPKKSCLIMKEKLAKRLDLVHSSKIKNEKGIPQLNCFFESLPSGELNGTL